MKWPYAAAVLILLLWGAIKPPLETKLHQLEDISNPPLLVHQAWPATSQLSYGFSIALFSGFRGFVANALWLEVHTAWEHQNWTRLYSLVRTVTSLQPESVLFWDIGAWHFGWNASLAAQWRETSNPARAEVESMHWIEKSRTLLEESLAIHPNSTRLLLAMADLHWHRLRDYRAAALFYERAAAQPNAPAYAKRLAALAYEQAGDLQIAYQHFQKIWQLSKEHPARSPDHWELIQTKLIELEEKLDLPATHPKLD